MTSWDVLLALWVIFVSGALGALLADLGLLLLLRWRLGVAWRETLRRWL